jgi:hypothetical protein
MWRRTAGFKKGLSAPQEFILNGEGDRLGAMKRSKQQEDTQALLQLFASEHLISVAYVRNPQVHAGIEWLGSLSKWNLGELGYNSMAFPVLSQPVRHG